nr:VTT domain-containing protein [endosymbiont 'TC1' of Trimyema compressum]
MSFDIVSYAAGLTSMSFPSFFIATGLGQIPATILYSYFGQQITRSAKIFLYAFSAIIIIGILVMLFKKSKKKESTEE